MKDQPVLFLSEAEWNEISSHAQETFPDECCGVVFLKGTIDQVHRLKNIQNQLHQLDPQTYPRTAAIAYAMDHKELEAVMDSSGRSGGKLKGFYHSQPKHEAYFFPENKTLPESLRQTHCSPPPPHVISIYDRVVKEIRAFAWSEEQKDFIEVTLTKT